MQKSFLIIIEHLSSMIDKPKEHKNALSFLNTGHCKWQLRNKASKVKMRGKKHIRRQYYVVEWERRNLCSF